MRTIAVFQCNDKLEPFGMCNKILIYKKDENGWKVIAEHFYQPVQMVSVKGIHEEMKRVLELIKDTKIVACKEIAGVPFSVLNAAGYYIFTVEDVEEKTLSGILNDIEANDIKMQLQDEMMKKARPIETETAGIYFLDFLALQKECPDITSKKALKPFLEQTPFLELKVICAHTPPWILNDKHFNVKEMEKDGKMQLLITRAQC